MRYFKKIFFNVCLLFVFITATLIVNYFFFFHNTSHFYSSLKKLNANDSHFDVGGEELPLSVDKNLPVLSPKMSLKIINQLCSQKYSQYEDKTRFVWDSLFILNLRKMNLESLIAYVDGDVWKNVEEPDQKMVAQDILFCVSAKENNLYNNISIIDKGSNKKILFYNRENNNFIISPLTNKYEENE